VPAICIAGSTNRSNTITATTNVASPPTIIIFVRRSRSSTVPGASQRVDTARQARPRPSRACCQASDKCVVALAMISDMLVSSGV
jgi:hypothetical protein